jgi:hypothetical protein
MMENNLIPVPFQHVCISFHFLFFLFIFVFLLTLRFPKEWTGNPEFDCKTIKVWSIIVHTENQFFQTIRLWGVN